MSQPSIGRMVTVKGVESNGANVQPAMITRVWGEFGGVEIVNLMLFPDAAAPYPRTGVPFYQTSAEAAESPHLVCCYWPDQV